MRSACFSEDESSLQENLQCFSPPNRFISRGVLLDIGSRESLYPHEELPNSQKLTFERSKQTVFQLIDPPTGYSELKVEVAPLESVLPEDTRDGSDTEFFQLTQKCNGKFIERYKQKVVDYALKSGVKRASQISGVNKQNIERWVKIGGIQGNSSGRKIKDPLLESALISWIFCQINSFCPLKSCNSPTNGDY